MVLRRKLVWYVHVPLIFKRTQDDSVCIYIYVCVCIYIYIYVDIPAEGIISRGSSHNHNVNYFTIYSCN